jgi:hypothetical protein
MRASEVLALPPPIGHTQEQFRACLLPGTPYARLSPFDVEPDASKLRRAHELGLATAIGLFHLLQEAFGGLLALHQTGLVHGDTELHNFIVSSSPLEMLPIDFESAMTRDAANEERWEATRMTDLDPILREALLLQCRLGPQPGKMAAAAEERITFLFADASAIARAIEERGAVRA